jgi:fluoride ion exporter CrcB/FEX
LQALAITTGLFGTMTALSLFAKPGSMLKPAYPSYPSFIPLPCFSSQALAITTGLFGTMSALSLFAKPGSMLKPPSPPLNFSLTLP